MNKFNHDCEHCVYLGSRTLYQYGRYCDYDYYYCQREKSLLARFGDDAPDYISRRASHLDHHHLELVVAGLLAVKQGLITTDDLKNF